MKNEVRILSSHCYSKICTGFIIRGKGIDGVVMGIGCRGLCKRLEERGFLGELRYSFGACSCGLPNPPQIIEATEIYMKFAKDVSKEVSKIVN